MAGGPSSAHLVIFVSAASLEPGHVQVLHSIRGCFRSGGLGPAKPQMLTVCPLRKRLLPPCPQGDS